MPLATRKALLVSVALACVGITGFAYSGFQHGLVSLPLALYYAAIVINTFFSVRVFTTLTPKSSAQTLFDAVLLLLYVALAFSFGSATLFAFVSGIFFLVSIGKYMHLRTLILERAFLARKISINTLAALLSLFAFGLALFGLESLAAWMLGITFALANVYLLAIRPMYQLDA